MSDDQVGCEWVSVSSGIGLPGLSRTKAVKRLCVCVCLTGVLALFSNLKIEIDWKVEQWNLSSQNTITTAMKIQHIASKQVRITFEYAKQTPSLRHLTKIYNSDMLI